MIRIIRNKARIGKRWLVVEGDYRGHLRDGGPKWHTDVQLSEHDTEAEAERAIDERAKP